MPRAFHRADGSAPGNLLDRSAQLLNRTERISRPMHEQSRDVDVRKVRRPQLLRPIGRVQRIAEQQQTVCHVGVLRSQHAGLAPAIRVASYEDAPRSDLAKPADRLADAGAILPGRAWMRRSVRPAQAEGKIESIYRDTGFGEGIRHGREQRGLAVDARAMRERQPVRTAAGRPVQKARLESVNRCWHLKKAAEPGGPLEILVPAGG